MGDESLTRLDQEWIHFRDDADETGGSGEGSSSVTANGKDSKPSSTTAVDPSNPRNQWVPVPPEPSMANSTCPICQEKFDMVWLDEAQEWVWMDAVRVGPRIFHASCHAEVAQGNSGTPVIGKRKAEEGESIPVRAKMKR
ncbi:MAG: hypothetical protein M1817_004480 [Caeruleum heppii]|nr:MAG: hypothetical protein M1817_004480 [Caeruleum heppii]